MKVKHQKIEIPTYRRYDVQKTLTDMKEVSVFARQLVEFTDFLFIIVMTLAIVKVGTSHKKQKIFQTQIPGLRIVKRYFHLWSRLSNILLCKTLPAF